MYCNTTSCYCLIRNCSGDSSVCQASLCSLGAAKVTPRSVFGPQTCLPVECTSPLTSGWRTSSLRQGKGKRRQPASRQFWLTAALSLLLLSRPQPQRAQHSQHPVCWRDGRNLQLGRRHSTRRPQVPIPNRLVRRGDAHWTIVLVRVWNWEF